MDVSKIKFSLILTGVLIVSAFIPILNILIWYLNAALMYVFGDGWDAHIWMNLFQNSRSAVPSDEYKI
ncbi:MAG: hypothetical protein AAF620_13065 [Bacteroidota bacterium]